MMKLERESRNKLHNLSNPYQGQSKKVLTVCSAGLLRSPTAAIVLNREFGFNTRSCGIDINYALVPFSTALHQWADEIVVVELWMKNEIERLVKELAAEQLMNYEDVEVPVVCLNISDSYAYMEDQLQALIVRKYDEDASMSALQKKITEDLNIRD